MPQTNIVNIINFIRAVEPRDPDLDLVQPVVQQIRLVEKHGLPATWLVQYDALLDSRLIDPLKALDKCHEIGAWFEVVQPMVEKAGLSWRGRYPWDWHTDVGFSVGYTRDEREKLADVFMEEFRRVFGEYPRSVGSWLMDAHLIGYLHERYGIVSCCICKDQWGTDGYTLWGGYFNQAYYPSRRNMYMPAQHPSEQIDVPVFRMLGSDPIYQYDADTDGDAQGVITLEPVYKEGGGSPEWVDWFFDTNFKSPCLSFGYTQVGQENSFGWRDMSEGLTFQVEQLAKRAADGEIRVETLGESGRWFMSVYQETPASAVTALADWKGENHKSIWYCSRFYRVNLYWDEAGFKIRDIHLFDETYAEPYLSQVCTENACTYDTLPVLDGFLWSDRVEMAGIRIFKEFADGSTRYVRADNPRVTERSAQCLIVECDEGIELFCGDRRFQVRVTPHEDVVSWGLELAWAGSNTVALDDIQGNTLHYTHNGHSYSVSCIGDELKWGGKSKVIIKAEGSGIALQFASDE